MYPKSLSRTCCAQLYHKEQKLLDALTRLFPQQDILQESFSSTTSSDEPENLSGQSEFTLRLEASPEGNIRKRCQQRHKEDDIVQKGVAHQPEI